MSAEQLFFQHAREDWFRENLFRRQKESTGREFPRSIVGILGETIAEAGANGLRAIAFQRERKGTVAVRSTEIEEATQADIMTNFSAVILGTTLVMIEELLISRGYSPSFHLSAINRLLEGTSYGPYRYDDPKPRSQTINRGNFFQLCEAADRDPTLAIFFEEEGFRLLPVRIIDLLDAPGPHPRVRFIDHILSLLPAYKELASEFVESKLKTPLPGFLKTIK